MDNDNNTLNNVDNINRIARHGRNERDGVTEVSPVPEISQVGSDVEVDDDYADMPPLDPIDLTGRSEVLDVSTNTPQPGLGLSASAAGNAVPPTDVDMSDPEEVSLPPLPPIHFQIDSATSDPSTSSATSSALPDLQPSRSSRRARVEDDVDEEDIRETNRRRRLSPQATHQPPLPLPQQLPPPPYPLPQGANHSRTYAMHEAGPHRIVLDFVVAPPNAPHGPQQAPPQGQPQPPHTFNFAQLFDQMRSQPGATPPGFFEMLFGGGGMSFGEEPDDPERARRLLAGLEEVPGGLVKRLQRVGGNGEADSGPGCAVCWESLLDGDGGFGGEKQVQEGEQVAQSLSSDDHPTASTSSQSDSSEKKYPKIVALPCSHVFHSSCLLPWFTQAHHTTCPSCRFDIDPDSLTYVPRPIRPTRAMPRRNRAAQQGQAQPATPPTAGQHPPTFTAVPPPQPDVRAAPQPQVSLEGAMPPPGIGIDVFVVDMGEEIPPLQDDPTAAPHTHADAQPPHAGPAGDAQPNTNQAEGQDQPPPPYGFLGFDVSMAFVFGTAGGGGANTGTAHIHMPHVFGGTFPVPGPQGATGGANGNGVPSVFGPAPAPPPAANANDQQQATAAAVQTLFEQLVGGVMNGAAPGHIRTNPNTTPNAPANAIPTPTTEAQTNIPQPAPATPTAGAQQTRTHPQHIPTATAHGASPPAPPTFAQFFQRLFPGAPIPQVRTPGAPGARTSPPQQPQNAPGVTPQAANNANPGGNVGGVPPQPGETPEEQQASMAHLFEHILGIRPNPNPTANLNANANQAGAGQTPGRGAGVRVGDFPNFPFVPGAPGATNAMPGFFAMFGGPQPTGRRRRARTASNNPTDPSTPSDTPPAKPQWVLPPPPGPTLRQRVEKRERELGLRCSNISCGLGPTDEDPDPLPGLDLTKVRQVGIHPLKRSGKDTEMCVCEHQFHLACLVSAERVAGWGQKGEEEKSEGEEVEVSCPVCRAVGSITKEEWDEGVFALV